ncbi:cupin domain-containing protein [Photorhabdus thracensis]|uniref:hypothetical protein n=1 Tax=Photorhabdus thracensis TaxID=230089 RepID=UPI001E4F61BF|nr:hypothetical protein [Photorhabdus thracensis]MCC8422714.1 hypothetical protein [Photorhabdus thracensis]
MDIDGNWALRLLEASEGLKSPVHLKAIMPGYAQVLEVVCQMFTHFSPSEQPRVRSWVGGGQRYTITDALISLAPRTDLTLNQRLAMANESAEFCVTFNGLSAWSPLFTEQMQRNMLEPLFEALGSAPDCGVDFYAFFGNYGYTPFGVHDDIDQSLLWHLGPTSKIAFVWPREKYIELSGGTLSTTNYESLLPHALRYELQPGDLLFIPMGDFHILETQQFSATLGLTLFPDNVQLESSEGLRLFAPDDKSFVALATQPISLQELAQLRRLAVRSNGFIITPSELSTVAVVQADEAKLRRSTLYAPTCWPLLHMRLGNREALLVRRRVIWGRPNELFATLCELLNSGERIPYETLERSVAGKVNPAAVAELVRTTVRLGGLIIEPL